MARFALAFVVSAMAIACGGSVCETHERETGCLLENGEWHPSSSNFIVVEDLGYDDAGKRVSIADESSRAGCPLGDRCTVAGDEGRCHVRVPSKPGAE